MTRFLAILIGLGLAALPASAQFQGPAAPYMSGGPGGGGGGGSAAFTGVDCTSSGDTINCTSLGGINPGPLFAVSTLGTGLQIAAGELFLTNEVEDRSAGNDAIESTDFNKTVILGAHSYTIAEAGTTGFEAGWGAYFVNTAATAATLTATNSTFEGASATTTLSIPGKSSVYLQSYGGDYLTSPARYNSAPAPTGGANTPLFNDGSAGFTNGTRSGNTTAVVTTTGTQTSGRCVEIDANGNHIAAASACASGSAVAPLVLSSGAGTVSTTAIYLGASATGTAATASRPAKISYASTFSDLYCSTAVAAGAGVTYTWTLNVNGADQSNVTATQTNSADATPANNTPVNVAAGSYINAKFSTSSGSPNTGASCSFKVVPQ